MNDVQGAVPVVRFGTFEVNLDTRELRKLGMRIRLEEKPFQILELLLERAGHVVSRQRLRERLWPDTHVGYEHGLNTAVNKLRDLLGDSARSPRYIETLPRLGYRFIAQVMKPGEPAAAAKRMLLVLPFENLCGDDEQEFFADGLTEEMICQFGRLSPKRLGVIARTSAIQYKSTKKSIGEIASELNVDCVLEGSIRCDGQRMRITGQLIETRDQTHLWSATFDREMRDPLDVQTDVAREIGKALALELLPA
jgi:TolB-like protein